MNTEMGKTVWVASQRWFFRLWRPAVLLLTLAAVVYLLYFRRLGILLPGYATPEINTYLQASNWHNIAVNPINAPYSVVLWLIAAVLHHNLVATRLIAAGFGILAVVAFFAVIRPWYSFRIASLGTLLFATSAGFLHMARLGTPQILQMSVLALLFGVLWYRRSREHRILIGYCLAVLCALLWYIPGMIWFEVLGLCFLWRTVAGQLQRMPKKHVLAWAGLFAVTLVPLGLATARKPELLLAAAGLPHNLDALSHLATNFAHAVLSIGIYSSSGPLIWLGHMPLLNAAERVLMALGLYVYLFQQRSRSGFFLLGATLLSLGLISCGATVGFATLVPLLYLFVVHGLDYLLKLWFTVFPRNPIARYSGVAIICVLLCFSILYQTRAYFIAWPHNTGTRETFSHTIP